jgi:HEAT repeat protein
MDQLPQKVPMKKPAAEQPVVPIINKPPTGPRRRGSNTAVIVLSVVGGIGLLLLLSCGGIGYFVYTKYQQAKRDFTTLTQGNLPRPQPNIPAPPPWQPGPSLPPQTTPINSVNSAVEALRDQNPFRQDEAINYLASQPVDSAKQPDVVNSFVPLMSDLRRREQARRVLEKWATANDVPRLIGVAQAAHTKGDRDTQRLAVALLAKLGDARAGDAIAKYYGSQHDIFAARKAMESLGAGAVPHLVAYFNDSDHGLRQTARDLLAQHKADELLLARQCLKDLQSTDANRQREAARWLGANVVSDETLSPQVAKALLGAMNSREARQDAAAALEFWATADTVPALVTAARTAHSAHDFDGERAIVRLLTKFNDPQALPAYIDYFEARHDLATAQAALSGLGEEAAPSLVAYIHHPDANIRQTARQLLTQWKSEPADWVAQSLADLESGDANRQREAARWLAEADIVADHQADISKALVPLLSNIQLRHDGMRALKKWAHAGAVPALLPLLDQQDYFLRQEALAILVSLKDPRIVEPLAKSFGDTRYRHEVKRHLQAMGPVAESALFPYVTSADWSTAKDACEVLKEIGTRKALPALQQAAAGQHPFVPDAANAAIKAILEAKREPVTIAANVSNPTAAPSQFRKWTDATGKNAIEAEFVEVKLGKVRLKKKDGKFLSLPLENLSAADQAWVKKNSPSTP